MAKTVAYLRVSTADKGQEFDRQVYEFDKQGIVVDKYFEEKLSGKLDIEDRPAHGRQRTPRGISAENGTVSRVSRTVLPSCVPFADCATATATILLISTAIRVASTLFMPWKEWANTLSLISNFNSTQKRIWQI